MTRGATTLHGAVAKGTRWRVTTAAQSSGSSARLWLHGANNLQLICSVGGFRWRLQRGATVPLGGSRGGVAGIFFFNFLLDLKERVVA